MTKFRQIWSHCLANVSLSKSFLLSRQLLIFLIRWPMTGFEPGFSDVTSDTATAMSNEWDTTTDVLYPRMCEYEGIRLTTNNQKSLFRRFLATSSRQIDGYCEFSLRQLNIISSFFASNSSLSRIFAYAKIPSMQCD